MNKRCVLIVVACLWATAVPAADVVVEIYQFKFEPASVTLAPGDTITWVNKDIVPHTASSTDKYWDTGQIAPGQSVTLDAFTSDNSVLVQTYLCLYHPTMRGEVMLE